MLTNVTLIDDQLTELEILQTYTNSQLLTLKSQLLELSRQTSDMLTYWLDQREQTMMDSEAYNKMIERLVGHAQKMRDGKNRQDKIKKSKNRNSGSGGFGNHIVVLLFI